MMFLGIGHVNGQHLDFRGYVGATVLQLSTDEEQSLIDGILHDRSLRGRPGVQAGVSLSVGNQFYVEPGLQYSTLSVSVTNINTTSGLELLDKSTLHVVSVPVKAGIKIINPDVEDIVNVRLFGGLDGHHVLAVNHREKSGSIDDIEVEDFHNLILNADLGIGLDVAKISLETGYQLGLTSLYANGDKSKANMFYVNVGLRIL